jgi:aspartate 1-decarboxylase
MKQDNLGTMMRLMLWGKIHRATVTQCDPDYVGSITIDQDLLDAARILPYEQVHVYDIDNGVRLTTYAVAGERGTGIIGMNGAAAKLVDKGHKVIIAAYTWMEKLKADGHKPHIVLVDENNAFKEV